MAPPDYTFKKQADSNETDSLAGFSLFLGCGLGTPCLLQPKWHHSINGGIFQLAPGSPKSADIHKIFMEKWGK